MENRKPVRVRMAPSPTGNLHLGTAYTTLFNYLFAKKNNGVFIMRLEDTDQERSKKEYEENILAGLKWLGLSWDEGPFRQTERLSQYEAATKKLLETKQAYFCFCTPDELNEQREFQRANNLPLVYSGACRNLLPDVVEQNVKLGKSHVIRYRMPEERGSIEFNDLLHGNVSFEAKLIGDFVIMRSNGIPLYNYAVVVDDIDMQITHVLRGEDHLSNTPKQIVLFEALESTSPQYAHWPSILNPDRIGKLSKRQGATSIDDFRKDGFLPEAIVNYLALLGWTMPDEREIMSLAEMEKVFEINKMRLSGAAYNEDKFEWMNGEYIRMLTDEQLTERLQEFLVDHPHKEKIAPVVPLIKERIKKLSEFIPLTWFIWEKPEYDMSVFRKIKIPDVKKALQEIDDTLKTMPHPWNSEKFESTFRSLAEKLNIPARELFQLIRVAVSGQLVSPPLFESIELIGEAETMERVHHIADLFPDIPDAAQS